MGKYYEQVKLEFSSNNTGLTDGNIKRLENLCDVYAKSPEDLYIHWETFITKINETSNTITESLIDKFQDYMSSEGFKSTLSNSYNNIYNKNFNNKKNTFIDIDVNDENKSNNLFKKRKIKTEKTFSSPKRNSIGFTSPKKPNLFSPTKYPDVKDSDKISSATSKFLNRTRKGETEEILNKNIKISALIPNSEKNISISLIDENQIQDSYRYMYSNLNEMGEIIDNRIEEISELIKDKNNIEEFAFPHIQIQEEFVTAGKICSDILDIDDETKINEKSLLIEPCRKVASGHRVKLDLSNLASKGKSYTLFPGQIVAVKGTNITGHCINVNDIIEPPSLDVPTSTLDEIEQYYENSKGQPLSVFVATGPYTCDDSLNYEPLNELFDKYIIPEKPDILILMGPFVDDRHPMIVNGEVDSLPEEIFHNEIASKILNFYNKSPNSKIILIPSNHDIITNSLCFPQPPLDSEMAISKKQFNFFNKDDLEQVALQRRKGKRENLGLPIDYERIFCYPNPVQFQVNDIIFGVCNNDILSHIDKQEVFHSSNPFSSPTKGISNEPSTRKMDKISRLTRHLLQQRSFYPLFPPALNEANIVYEQSKGYHINYKPDILILNSSLRRFAKEVDGVICVNPGQVVHKVSSTFSKLYINPINPQDINNQMNIDKDRLIHEVSERCRVEIQRV